jgi:anaerobic selenocysteine-containing dehydrogenase
MKQPHVDISGEMAKRLNITDGDRVRVYNERGSWIGIAKIKEGIHPDTLFIEEGWWKSLGANVNELTPNGLSDMGKGSSQYDCKVAIEKC